MAVFYPSCVCNLRVTFDDAFEVIEGEPESVIEATAGTPRAEGPPTIRPLVLEADKRRQADRINTIFNRVPISCSVDLPSYRQAGTFNMTLAYRDLPIDPRIVYSAGVEIYMGAVDPNNFATGMVKVESDGSRRSILNTVGPGGARREDLLLMVGTVDTWDVSHSDGASTVTMSGRDLRALFLDARIDPRIFEKLDLKRPIHDVVRQLLDHHPLGDRFVVEVNLEEWQVGKDQTLTLRRGEESLVPLPSPAEEKGRTRVRRGADGARALATPQGGESLNYWDLITRYCMLVGGVPYFMADRLVIRPAKGLYQQLGEDGENARSAPFKDGKQRTIEGGQRIGLRRIVFGRDVLEYRFSRKYAGVTRPTVRVVCLDTSSRERGVGKLLEAFSPKDKAPTGNSASVGRQGGNPGDRTLGDPKRAKTTHLSPSGSQSTQDILTIPVSGIKDTGRLQDIADSIREEIARGEIGGSVSTRSLASFGTAGGDPTSGNQDPDLLRLRPGDAVEILVDLRDLTEHAPLVSSYVDSRRRSFQEEVDDLTKRIGAGAGGRDVARVLVAQARGAILGLQSFFRVGTARFAWDGRGIGISFDFQNYVEARDDIVARARRRQAEQAKRFTTTPGRQQPSKLR